VTLGISLIIMAVGAILVWAIDPSGDPAVDPQVTGVILMIVGFVAFILDLMLWSQWGPGYVRRRRVVAGDPVHVTRRVAAPRRAAVVEEEVVEEEVVVTEPASPGGPPPPPP
jgi:hypothetical protein